ncbi:MAG: nitroreductase family protein [Bacillota bacterium]|nr:nitroreductase family protein [Bacillota bacterium]
MKSIKSYLKERKSTRNFQDRRLNTDDTSNVRNAIKEVADDLGWDQVQVDLIENGEKVYKVLDGKAGYNGVFVKAWTYMPIKYSADNLINQIKAAFYIGNITTKLYQLKLGSVVITLGDNIKEEKEALFGPDGKDVHYIIGLGYPEDKKAFTPEPSAPRLNVEDIVFLDENFEKPATDKLREMNLLDLFSDLKYAPSYKNLQPWRFVLDNGILYAYVKNGEMLDHSVVDVGLSMYFFQELAKSMGIDNNWEILENIDPSGDYIKLGRYKI